jgi:alkylation response protein AidB-like acyl-CoA dehydrogenase
MFELPEELRLLKKAVREWALKRFDPQLALELEKEELPFKLWREANKLGFLNVRFQWTTEAKGWAYWLTLSSPKSFAEWTRRWGLPSCSAISAVTA